MVPSLIDRDCGTTDMVYLVFKKKSFQDFFDQSKDGFLESFGLDCKHNMTKIYFTQKSSDSDNV